jgi:hypothetical protein
MTKIKNRIFAIPAEAPAIPPNPKAAALPPSHRGFVFVEICPFNLPFTMDRRNCPIIILVSLAPLKS